MSDYLLKDVAHFTEYEGEITGLLFNCPNCGAAGTATFGGTRYRERYPGPMWERAGKDLETISLHPSVMMYGHFHCWIRNGKLCIDSPFSCKPKAISA